MNLSLYALNNLREIYSRVIKLYMSPGGQSLKNDDDLFRNDPQCYYSLQANPG